MKRDLDLIRNILLKIEAADSPITNSSISIDGYSEEVIERHIALLYEAGYIHGRSLHAPRLVGAKVWQDISLTWEGHEFLDAARNETIWAKARTQISQVGNSVGLDIVKEVLNALLRQALGL